MYDETMYEHWTQTPYWQEAEEPYIPPGARPGKDTLDAMTKRLENKDFEMAYAAGGAWEYCTLATIQGEVAGNVAQYDAETWEIDNAIIQAMKDLENGEAVEVEGIYYRKVQP